MKEEISIQSLDGRNVSRGIGIRMGGVTQVALLILQRLLNQRDAAQEILGAPNTLDQQFAE